MIFLKIVRFSLEVIQPLHLLQQFPGKLPAGAVGGIQQAPDALCFAGHIKAGLGLALGRHILIARQSGADVGAKALHFIHRSFLPGLRGGPRAGEHAGGHSVNDGHIGIHADCLTVFHFVFLLFFGNIYTLCTRFYHAPEENEIGVIFVEWRRVFLRHFSFITRCV